MFDSDMVMLGITFIIFVIFLYLTYKVIQIIKLQDKTILSMLVFLDLTLACKNYPSFLAMIPIAKILYFVIDGLLNKQGDDSPISNCLGNVASTLPVLFFSIAVLININKWLYFYF